MKSYNLAVIGALAMVLAGLIAIPPAAEAEAAKAFTFKLSVWASDAQPDMDNMHVKVTITHVEVPYKTKTKSKGVDFGKILEHYDTSTIPVAKFEFKNIHNGDLFTACITGPGVEQCDEKVIQKKSMKIKIPIGFWD